MNAAELFQTVFAQAPDAVESAPGRVNLIGEHTDYNGGFVLPLAIPQATQVAVRLTSAGAHRAVSAQLSPISVFNFALEPTKHRSLFVEYLKGALAVLGQAGHSVAGIELAVDSTVPIGSGLASSAALLVATLRALARALGVDAPPELVADWAYRAEHDFVGIPVGRMDPMACAFATPDHALFLNTDSLAHESVALPGRAELVVLDSGLRHTHGTGGYRQRRAECELAAATLGVEKLCTIDPNREFLALPQWERLSGELRARVRHVVSENQRVLAAVDAMRREDLVELGTLLDASHASLRDDFAVSTPEVNALVEVTRRAPGCFGARMTGGGFGGAIVALVQAGFGKSVAEYALDKYHERVTEVRGTAVVPATAHDETEVRSWRDLDWGARR